MLFIASNLLIYTPKLLPYYSSFTLYFFRYIFIPFICLICILYLDAILPYILCFIF